MDAIHKARGLIRAWLTHVARFINQFSGGRISAAHITLFSVAAHVLVAWALIESQLWLSAGLLAAFGLLDAVDGALARLQNKASELGIVLDATADRIKETIVYAGIVVYLAGNYDPPVLIWAVLALGLSITLSYIKAKGEAVIASSSPEEIDAQALNRFIGGDSLMQFDIRMAVLVAGFLLDAVLGATIVIGLGSLGSILSRYNELKRLL
ncbi:MAG TPA: CDP-alcohol phosphatidyltransferase family protein [Candidatus Saccharimonadales bacterium]